MRYTMMKIFFFMMLLPIMGICSEPVIWLVGDSTVSTYKMDRYPQTGWGQVLQQYCKPGVKVCNYAVGGRSSKSFISEKRWEKVLHEMKKGDFLFVQFGHNDQKKDKARHTNPATTYQEYLKQYISEAREKGINVILVTSVVRRVFREGKMINSLGKYPDAMKHVAAETQTPLIDLNVMSFHKFSEMGSKETKKVFLHVPVGKFPAFPKGCKDNSHFCKNGAVLIAGWVVNNAKKQNLKVAELFR